MSRLFDKCTSLAFVLWMALSGIINCSAEEFSSTVFPLRIAENLDRGLVVNVTSDSTAFLSWRLLPGEEAGAGFDVWRRSWPPQAAGSAGAAPAAPPARSAFVKLNTTLLQQGTCYIDSSYQNQLSYEYCVLPQGHIPLMAADAVVPQQSYSCSSRDQSDPKPEAHERGARYVVAAHQPVQNYLSIPLQTLEGHRPGDASLGDLDGDGRYEIVLKQEMMPRDNSHAGFTGQSKLEAYNLDGQMLWRINLGINIREGAHYTPFLVYDLDGDGKAEVVCKTADGSVDGQGHILGDATADWRNQAKDPGHTKQQKRNKKNQINQASGKYFEGVILQGPEYLSVFDGESGAFKASAKYIPSRHPEKENPSPGELKDIWGDGYGNRSERYLACIAYLDGKRPSIVMCRGYYTRVCLSAWTYQDGQLQHQWLFDSDNAQHPENRAARGMGNHNLSVADLDQDGCDEIVYGNVVIDHDGRMLYSTGIGHADAMHLSDLDPERPGLEIFNTQEPVGAYGMNFRQAGSGEIYWNVATDSVAVSYERKQQGPGRAAAFDIDPNYPGAECWVYGGGIRGLYNSKGELISKRTPASCNFGIYWDGDPLRELLDGTRIQKYIPEQERCEVIFRAEGCRSNNGSKSTPSISADIYGDWREEVIFPSLDNQELRIYSSTISTNIALPSLMYDPVYRLGIVWQNVGYNIPPHLSVNLVSKLRK